MKISVKPSAFSDDLYARTISPCTRKTSRISGTRRLIARLSSVVSSRLCSAATGLKISIGGGSAREIVSIDSANTSTPAGARGSARAVPHTSMTNSQLTSPMSSDLGSTTCASPLRSRRTRNRTPPRLRMRWTQPESRTVLPACSGSCDERTRVAWQPTWCGTFLGSIVWMPMGIRAVPLKDDVCVPRANVLASQEVIQGTGDCSYPAVPPSLSTGRV